MRLQGKASMAGAIAIGLLWNGYGFSVGHVRESMHLTPENMPSFQHFPGPLRGVARNMVISDSTRSGSKATISRRSVRNPCKTRPRERSLSELSSSHWYSLRILVHPELQNEDNLMTQLNASDRLVSAQPGTNMYPAG